MKRAIVVGHTGQDGTLLVRDLQQRGDNVIGFSRSKCLSTKSFGSEVRGDLRSKNDVGALVQGFLPDEIYYLAAHHASSEADRRQSLHEEFEAAQATHVTGLLYFLSAIAAVCPSAKLFYASSSLVFSGENGDTQDENTPLNPQGVYGITKAQGMWLCREFRIHHRVFASVGILYNHESHLRPLTFLSSKIIQMAIRISRGTAETLEIGSLSSRVDWGYAKDYVSAFQNILAIESPGDFIVATGEAHTVKEFIHTVFTYFGLDPQRHVVESRNILSRTPPVKIGNSQKLRSLTGWKPSFGFTEFVTRLIEDHLAAEGIPRR